MFFLPIKWTNTQFKKEFFSISDLFILRHKKDIL